MGLFDWFRTSQRQEEPQEEWWQRLARVEADMKQLALEWEGTYGKVRRALATLSRRQQREAEAGETEEPSADPQAQPNGGPDASDYAKLRSMYGRR